MGPAAAVVGRARAHVVVRGEQRPAGALSQARSLVVPAPSRRPAGGPRGRCSDWSFAAVRVALQSPASAADDDVRYALQRPPATLVPSPPTMLYELLRQAWSCEATPQGHVVSRDPARRPAVLRDRRHSRASAGWEVHGQLLGRSPLPPRVPAGRVGDTSGAGWGAGSGGSDERRWQEISELAVATHRRATGDLRVDPGATRVTRLDDFARGARSGLRPESRWRTAIVPSTRDRRSTRRAPASSSRSATRSRE